jgi:diguanylate cyclase (GGDEF)-like protein
MRTGCGVSDEALAAHELPAQTPSAAAARGRARRHADLTLSDYVSFTQRIVMVTILIVLRSLGVLELGGAPSWALDVGIGVMLLVATFGAISTLASDLRPRTVLRIMLPADVLSTVLIVWAVANGADPLYPWVIGLAMIYGVGLALKESVGFAVVITAAYLLGQSLGYLPGQDLDEFVFVGFKAVAIIVTAVLVGEGNRRLVAKEMEARSSEHMYQRLNRSLQRRLTEIHAVSDINEIIHSTLDFEQVGHLVLEIVSKVIDLPASALFIIDKRLDETLYSASFGVSAEMRGAPVSAFHHAIDQGSEMFACTTVLDRGNLMVVFCASGARLETLNDEDRLMLTTVANDLAVAVENSELYKLTKRLSITDELTGLYNYRFLLQRMDEEIERARRFERPLSLLMVDADEFKRFNDTHGHITGDHALAELADVLRSAVRDVDVVCRYGGEEFAVLLPETDAEGAFVAAEKLRDAVASHLFPDGDGTPAHRLTISLGLASFPRSADDREELLKQADHALYTAKHGGRNRVKAWGPDLAGRAPVPPATEPRE